MWQCRIKASRPCTRNYANACPALGVLLKNTSKVLHRAVGDKTAGDYRRRIIAYRFTAVPYNFHCQLGQPPRLMFAKKRSLRNLLVQTDHYPKYNPLPIKISTRVGCHRFCNCSICATMITSAQFSHPHTGKMLQIKSYLNCNSDHVIYILKCPCSLVYVGKTIIEFKKR